MTKPERTTRVLAPAVLLAAALFLPALAARAETPPAAPQTLELGKGPTIVIVHSLGGSRNTWMPTVRKLMGSHRVVLADLPGHGSSTLPDPFSLEAAAASLDLLLARQNADSTVVVGHGISGMLLLLDLKAHPERARGVVLIDASLKSPVKIEDAQQIRWFNEILDTRYDEFMRMYYSQAGRDSAEGVRIRATGSLTPAATMKAYLRSLFTADAGPAFESLKVPVLFVGTDQLFRERKRSASLSTQPGYADSVAARAKSSTSGDGDKDWGTLGKSLGYPNPAAVPLRRIANSGLLVMQDQPDTLAVIIADFTKQVLAAKRK